MIIAHSNITGHGRVMQGRFYRVEGGEKITRENYYSFVLKM